MNHKSNYFDVLRWISTASVLAIHVLMAFESDMRNILNWSVPMFVMISGALFLNPDKNITIKLLVSKYIKRIIISILLGSTVLEIIKAAALGNVMRLKEIAMLLLDSVNGHTPAHFWFLYMILSLYAFIPIIKTFTQNASDATLYFTMGLLFFANSLLPEIKRIFDINIIFYLPVTTIYFFYFVLGYLIHRRNWFGKLNISHTAAIVAACLITIFVDTKSGTGFFSYSYNSPVIVIISVGIFIAAKQMNASIRACSNYRELCFPIYLIHPFVMEVILHYHEQITGIALFAMTAIISLAISMLLSKIVLVRDILR